MRRIKSMEELKDGDLFEMREIKVRHGELGTFRGEFFTIDPQSGIYGLAHDSWRLREGELTVPQRQVKNGTIDFSTIDHQSKDKITAYIIAMSKERIESGWQEVYKLDDILEGRVKIHVV